MNTPDEIIQKTLYKIQSTRAQKQNATQVLLKRVQSSRAALKQELDTSKEVRLSFMTYFLEGVLSPPPFSVTY